MRRRMVVLCALGMLAPGAASAAGGGLVSKPDRNCPPTFQRLTILQVRDAVDEILVSQPLESFIAAVDNVVDANGDDVVCLRIGRPDSNPAHGGPHILPIDNTRR